MAEWLQMQLAQDAAVITDHRLHGREEQADAYMVACRWEERVAEWKAARSAEAA